MPPRRTPTRRWILLALGLSSAAACGARKNVISDKDNAVTEHAVTVHLPSPAEGDELALDQIEDPLIEAIDAAGVGEFDGHEVGPDEAVVYMYGPDADKLAAAIHPVLKSLPLPPGSYLIKRYGDVGAREERVNLAQ
jgi:hypothetical protein